ncbi:MAG TPA: cell wall hydrolase [Allosphingosinicella sp.]|uniref:cell wall hydrolase n=1 Tax=Allosphingosinicella sp. TaxID=2823234 RepID=UPI002ED8E1E8
MIRTLPFSRLFGALLLIACGLALVGLTWDRPALEAHANASVKSIRLPDAMPLELAALASQAIVAGEEDPEEARRVNAALPFLGLPAEAAHPFLLQAASPSDGARALHCLTQAVYYEAGFEPMEGRRAVAQVILNRVRHPAYPNSVCGVVYQGSTRPGCQFSFTCDGSLYRQPAKGAWEAAAAVARAALSGQVASAVGHATHYHADYVAPYWAPRLSKIAQIGTHIFYRWPGSWGLRRAFSDRYAGSEPMMTGSAVATPTAVAGADAGGAPPASLPLALDERRAENDVGGRLDVSKGWTLSIPMPTETRGSLASISSAQESTASVRLAAAERPEGGQ